MLVDLFEDLINAKNEKDKEIAFKNLEKVGVDRITAIEVVKTISWRTEK